MKEKQYRKSKVEKKKRTLTHHYPANADPFASIVHNIMDKQMKIKSKLNYEPDTTSRKMASQIK